MAESPRAEGAAPRSARPRSSPSASEPARASGRISPTSHPASSIESNSSRVFGSSTAPGPSPAPASSTAPGPSPAPASSTAPGPSTSSDSSTAAASTPRRGRIRSEAARGAVLAAASAQIQRLGYEHVTIEGIAAEAGVGKQTIYRWWPSKSAVVAECLLEGALLPESFAPPDTGNLARDLSDWFGEVFAFLAVPEHSAMVLSLLGASVENAEVGWRLMERLGVSPDLLTGRLERAHELGQLSSDGIVAVSDALLGTVVLRVLSRLDFDPDEGRAIARALVAG